MRQHGTFEIPPPVNFAHFRKVNVLVDANQPRRPPTQAVLLSEPCCLEELGQLEVANAALLF